MTSRESILADSPKRARVSRQGLAAPQRKAEEATEDYLETNNSLFNEKGYAASVDIAERMKGIETNRDQHSKKLHN